MYTPHSPDDSRRMLTLSGVHSDEFWQENEEKESGDQTMKQVQPGRKGIGKSLALIAAGGMLLLAGCGSYDADENTLFVKRNGEIYETNVQDYGGDQYSEEELKAFIEEEIGSYEGEGTVAVEDFKMEDAVATLTTRYSDDKAYAAFNKRPFFNGKVVLAQADGFTFDTAFFEPGETGKQESGSTEGTSVPRGDVTENPNLSVVILGENTLVSVPGKILYYSDHVTPQDKSTARVEGFDADSGIGGLAYIIYR